ncbi:ATP-grasp peptide maturase system methyltransferase [Streptomyces sp. NBC_00264]|uniref:ATP-grasp peptide maturase system methyltransferase n=1 Tax=unclassified Streptomyces TaxID=2593676 RepID=UPI000F5C09BC|nr:MULTISPECIES: ATP-grasp peptide maturase system methyltransferase [unclassified Streptomyces]WSG52970.1 ATP-grasp peptide maturase system methyltransferase [Streptomyces sp. NBC_01732]WSX03613.1 ATP-grasp peptide maturase system methyltransferase [Streptomyces sp. NBC_00987]MCX4394373.1 ATP-grasp peptide maturase system methyltransferase [Streptomyces sp. NBC_01767]MCX5102974.1 ATP-grasp peptide maturase system methyltransferase [Streptomyces sp. NBC_00439]MCX5162541.1 ATP-grasp peptide mat
MTDTSPERRKLAAQLAQAGALKTPAWRAAVEAVPRELFLNPGVFLPEGAQWRPVTAVGSDPAEWVRTAYTLDTLTTQLDGHLTADQVSEPVAGLPTSSSTTPTLVLGMIESLDVESGHQVLEIGTGTGYSAALMCHRLGEDNVTTVEVDPEVAARADAALETAGYSTWTVTGDGLLGHPRRAPYDRVIATCAVRRIPYTWVRQTKPGGIILATVGSWANGAGLAKVTVNEDGEAEGRIIGPASFVQARSQTAAPVAGDLSARAAYADSERQAKVSPLRLGEWMPAFLAQLAAPGAQLVRATTSEGAQLLYLFTPERESFATLTPDGESWRVRQGGPVSLWDDIEGALTAWQEAGSPEITATRLRVTPASHQYWIDRGPSLRWEHRVA